MGFKFLKTEEERDPLQNMTRERFREMVEHRLQNQQQLTTQNRPAVFVNINRNRNTISENELEFIMEQQKRNLMCLMSEQGMINQTIISEDIEGFSIRTEINF